MTKTSETLHGLELVIGKVDALDIEPDLIKQVAKDAIDCIITLIKEDEESTTNVRIGQAHMVNMLDKLNAEKKALQQELAGIEDDKEIFKRALEHIINE